MSTEKLESQYLHEFPNGDESVLYAEYRNQHIEPDSKLWQRLSDDKTVTAVFKKSAPVSIVDSPLGEFLLMKTVLMKEVKMNLAAYKQLVAKMWEGGPELFDKTINELS